MYKFLCAEAPGRISTTCSYGISCKIAPHDCRLNDFRVDALQVVKSTTTLWEPPKTRSRAQKISVENSKWIFPIHTSLFLSYLAKAMLLQNALSKSKISHSEPRSEFPEVPLCKNSRMFEYLIKARRKAKRWTCTRQHPDMTKQEEELMGLSTNDVMECIYCF